MKKQHQQHELQQIQDAIKCLDEFLDVLKNKHDFNIDVSELEEAIECSKSILQNARNMERKHKSCLKLKVLTLLQFLNDIFFDF